MNSSIDFSFDSARNLKFPGISTTDTFNSATGIKRIFFSPDNELTVFLSITYLPRTQLHNIYMFNASGDPLLMQERDEILQTEQSLYNWMAEQLLELKQQKLRNRRKLIDEI